MNLQLFYDVTTDREITVEERPFMAAYAATLVTKRALAPRCDV